MNWRKRIREWIILLRHEHGLGRPIPWAKMFWGILTPVPRSVWRRRIRTCHNCQLFDKERMACRGVMGPLMGIGCGCYVVFSALAPEPYVGKDSKGCYGCALLGKDFGWPEYVFPSKRAKRLAFVRFLLRH